MKNNRYSILTSVICILVVLSCTKDPLKPYSGANNIYFPWVGIADHVNVPYGRTPFDTIHISFANDVQHKADTVIYIPIQVQGYPSPDDRVVNVSIELDSSSPIQAVLGIDYTLPNTIVLKANQVVDTIPLTIYHTAALDTSYTLFTLILSKSNDLEVNYNYLATGGGLNPTRISINATGLLTQPSRWNDQLYGVFSRKKWDTMLEVIPGFSYEVFEDPNLDTSLPGYWVNVMNQYFVEQYNNPPDHSGAVREEDGSLMTMYVPYPTN